MLKSFGVVGGGGVVGGPKDFSVSPSPFGTDFDWVCLGWGWALGVWDLGRGLTICLNKSSKKSKVTQESVYNQERPFTYVKGS